MRTDTQTYKHMHAHTWAGGWANRQTDTDKQTANSFTKCSPGAVLIFFTGINFISFLETPVPPIKK